MISRCVGNDGQWLLDDRTVVTRRAAAADDQPNTSYYIVDIGCVDNCCDGRRKILVELTRNTQTVLSSPAIVVPSSSSSGDASSYSPSSSSSLSSPSPSPLPLSNLAPPSSSKKTSAATPASSSVQKRRRSNIVGRFSDLWKLDSAPRELCKIRGSGGRRCTRAQRWRDS